MKPFITVQRAPSRMRECIPLREMTDCLLQAYESVARRAYQRFLRRGGVPGGELNDWLCAERELLGTLAVDLEDAGDSLSALASVPGLSGGEVEVGIDSRWLVILGRNPEGEEMYEIDEPELDPDRIAEWASSVHTDARALRVCCERGKASEDAEATERKQASPSAIRADAGIKVSIAMNGSTDKCSGSSTESERREKSRHEPAPVRHESDPEARCDGTPSQLFCVVELPAEVEPDRSIAVLANGLLGIRMPKRAAGNCEGSNGPRT
jgi:HSP20 family molecular chaperone IbpA